LDLVSVLTWKEVNAVVTKFTPASCVFVSYKYDCSANFFLVQQSRGPDSWSYCSCAIQGQSVKERTR